MQYPPFVSTRRPRLGLLIDAENFSARKAPRLMARVFDRGEPIIRRAYADWTNPRHLGRPDASPAFVAACDHFVFL